ncbi:MAG TPA: sigma-70 family RNA polymerase sigma factor [Stellaceae bacterium]|nr:sigma-70 family RNA polymerase sigma factor [Stellaceae bacterium]
MTTQPFSDADLLACLPKLRRYAYSLTRNPADAEDLVQQTIMRALTKRHLFEPGTNLTGWLMTLAHNQRINSVRKAVRESTIELEPEQVEQVRAVVDPEARRLLSEVEAAMRRLPRGQRRLLMQAALSADNYEEMAAYEAIPVGTVRSRLSRARQALRALVHGAELGRDEREHLGL